MSLEEILSKLKVLDSINSNINKITSRIDGLDTRVAELENARKDNSGSACGSHSDEVVGDAPETHETRVPTSSTDRIMSPDSSSILKEFSENTTLHGFSHVVRQRSRYNKLGWKNKMFVLITLTCIGLASNNVFYIIEDYLRHPMVTGTHVEHRDSLVFPAITICNNNREWISTSTTSDSCRSLNNNPRCPFLYTNPNGQGSADISCQNVSVPCRERHLYSKGHSIDMLKGCTFGTSDCNWLDFYWTYDQVYGNCYTFNSHMDATGKAQELLRVEEPGIDTGLTLMLDIESYFYPPSSDVLGLRMMVHDNRQRPFPGDKSIILSPGMHTYVSVNKREVVRAEPPYGNCIDIEHQDHAKRSFFSNHYIYSRSACLKTCRQLRAMVFCNCCVDTYPCNPQNVSHASTGHYLPNSVGSCNNTEAKQCTTGPKGDPFLRACEEKCQPRCSDTTYDMEVSSADWPPFNAQPSVRFYPDDSLDKMNGVCDNLDSVVDSMIEAMVNDANIEGYGSQMCSALSVGMLRAFESDTYSRYRGDHLKVTVYLESLDVHKDVQSPKYEWSSFLSNVGGVMGLFTGFSILSFFEIVELLIDLWGHVISVFHRHVAVKPVVSPSE